MSLKPPMTSVSARPQIPGLTFRNLHGPQDYVHILNLITGCKHADGVERADTLETLTLTYTHLTNCDPSRDLLFAEVNGQVVGYNRVWWNLEENGPWIGTMFGMVLPAWRRQGIGSYLLQFGEERIRQMAAQANDANPHGYFYAGMASSSETARMALLEKNGYRMARMEYDMLRPDLENIPEAPLPAGLEVRPVLPEHMPLIFQAMNEAFRDHWGYVPPSESDYQEWLHNPRSDPSLWRVAWDGDQVVGSVQSYISQTENAEYGRLRGYTEEISVRRNWRRRGLARALLVQSLHAVKAAGMLEAALGVDSQNPNQAFTLYESVGFRTVKQLFFYRKPL